MKGGLGSGLAANVVRRSFDREDDAVVDDKDGSSTASARSTDEYWDRMVSWRGRRTQASDRGASRLFDHEAERYDRCRPRYPGVVIDALLGPEPAGLEVLDVGCGTGIAAVPMAERAPRFSGWNSRLAWRRSPTAMGSTWRSAPSRSGMPLAVVLTG